MTGAAEVVTGLAAEGAPEPAHPVALDYLLVGGLTVLTAVTTLFAVFFLPMYVGTVPVPLSVLVGAAMVYWAVRMSYRLTRSMLAAFAPAVGWLAVSMWLSLSTRFGYGLVIGDWRAMLMLGLGALATAVSLANCWASQLAAEVGRSPGRPAG